MDIIRVVLENQLTAANAEEIHALFADHDGLIRTLAMYVSEGKAGKDDERRNLMGAYYDEVQQKVTWAYNTAKEVWDGKWGNGDVRKKALGADFDLVQYWVKTMKPGIYLSDVTVKDTNGVYRANGIPTSVGNKTWIAFDQHNSGSTHRIDGSGCGLCSFLSIVGTFKDSAVRPQSWCKANLKSVTGFTACPISISAGTKILDKYGIGYERVKSFDTDSAYKDIQNHLSHGRPVIVSLSCRNRSGKKTDNYTNSGHYSLLIGMKENGKAFLMDSGGRKPRWVDLWDLCDHIPVNSANGDTKQTWVWQGEGGYVKVNV